MKRALTIAALAITCAFFAPRAQAVFVAFFDSDIAQIPVQALKKPKTT